MTSTERAHVLCSARTVSGKRCMRRASFVVRTWEPHSSLECIPDFCAQHAATARRWCLQRGEEGIQIWRVVKSI